MRKTIRKTTIFVLTLLFLVACTKEAEKTPVETTKMTVPENVKEIVTPQGETSVIKEPIKETESKETAKTVVRYNVEASQWAFKPGTITVKKGSHVILTITSKDVDHGFGIAAYGINQKLPAGRSVDVEFDADKVGEFPFYCTVYCGSGHSGMKGMLKVIE